MFGPTVPQHSIILLLSLVFCVIHPFVLLCGLVFFAMTLLVETYNWGWVFRRPYEGGGKLWKQVSAALQGWRVALRNGCLQYAACFG
jgi:hypothetical protein